MKLCSYIALGSGKRVSEFHAVSHHKILLVLSALMVLDHPNSEFLLKNLIGEFRNKPISIQFWGIPPLEHIFCVKRLKAIIRLTENYRQECLFVHLGSLNLFISKKHVMLD